MDTRRRLAPFVADADDLWWLNRNPLRDEEVGEVDPEQVEGEFTIEHLELGRLTLSEYLVLKMATRLSGESFSSPHEAYRQLVLGGEREVPVARVLSLAFRSREDGERGPSILNYIDSRTE